ncbi:MAG TPA: G1 family glutamic endopeptidase [Bacteroidia bacterium]|jgi:hypothetical protein|nr:G1 family glutamic endopeptidase [Bacteroidia bacterium]
MRIRSIEAIVTSLSLVLAGTACTTEAAKPPPAAVANQAPNSQVVLDGPDIHWAGHGFVLKKPITGMSAKITVPIVDCTTGTSFSSGRGGESGVSDWIGWTNGEGTSGSPQTVIFQAGEEVSCVNGTARYIAWDQIFTAWNPMYGGGVNVDNLEGMKPGDKIDVSLREDRNGRVIFLLRDERTGQHSMTTESSPRGNYDTNFGFVGLERKGFLLPNFKGANFSDIMVTTNGRSVPFESLQGTSIVYGIRGIENTREILARPDPKSNQGFTVIRQYPQSR